MIDLLKCPKCGREIKREWNYCSDCGLMLAWDKNGQPYDPGDDPENLESGEDNG